MELYQYLLLFALLLSAVSMSLFAVYEIMRNRRGERVMHEFNMFVSNMSPRSVSTH